MFTLINSESLNAQGYYDPNPRMRVIIDNDFAGDPDGIVALVQHLMSPSTDIRAVISSYFPMNSSPYGDKKAKDGATIGKKLAQQSVELLGLDEKIIVLQGSNTPMLNAQIPSESEGADFIIKEAMRNDTKQQIGRASCRERVCQYV